MDPSRSGWRKILMSLVGALLIAGSAGFVAAIAAYVRAPPRDVPDPGFLVLLAGLTLAPSMMLVIAISRAPRAAALWDFGRVGRNTLMVVSVTVAAILGISGLYVLVRLVKLLGAR